MHVGKKSSCVYFRLIFFYQNVTSFLTTFINDQKKEEKKKYYLADVIQILKNIRYEIHIRCKYITYRSVILLVRSIIQALFSMVDIDSPILIQEPFLDRPTPKRNPKHAIKPILIFIISFVVLSLVVTLTVTILVGKKKQATSTGTITHAFTTIITTASSTTIQYTSTTSITYTSPTTIKYSSTASITNTSPTKIESSATQAAIAITSVGPATSTMISCKKWNEKNVVSILNLRFYDFL